MVWILMCDSDTWTQLSTQGVLSCERKAMFFLLLQWYTHPGLISQLVCVAESKSGGHRQRIAYLTTVVFNPSLDESIISTQHHVFHTHVLRHMTKCMICLPLKMCFRGKKWDNHIRAILMMVKLRRRWNGTKQNGAL